MSTSKLRLELSIKTIDLIIINFTWWVSYYLRFESNILQAQEGVFNLYLKFSILLTFLNYYYFRSEGVYGSRTLTTVIQDIFVVIKANTFAFILFIFFSYFFSGHKLSRLFILNHYLLSSFLLIGFKIYMRKWRRGRRPKNCLLIGNTKEVQAYAEKISKHPEFGLKIQKWIKSDEEIASLTPEEIEQMKPDTVVFGDKLQVDTSNLLMEIIVLPDLSNSFVGYQIVNMMEGTPAIIINEPNFKSRSVIIKRLFDVILCSVGVILISPLLILIALLVKLTSKGPILYSQVRMGLDGKEFKMYKFRSMTTGAANKETWTVKDDPRVTKIGKFIRKTSLDELPQLFNVILGDMSLVGPRPERPVFVHQFKKNIPTYMLRHKMKAGITGWAQINGWRGDTSIEKRIECDLYYIKNWSIWMDLWIIFMTFWKGFINKNAY